MATVLFEGQVAVDVRVVCPQDVKKMLLKQAMMVYWKKRAAKHECEELKEGVSLEPIQAMLRRKVSDAWTDKCRKEVGCGIDCATSVGQTKRSVEDVTKKRAR